MIFRTYAAHSVHPVEWRVGELTQAVFEVTSIGDGFYIDAPGDDFSALDMAEMRQVLREALDKRRKEE
jgi:hypothetical protein